MNTPTLTLRELKKQLAKLPIPENSGERWFLPLPSDEIVVDDADPFQFPRLEFVSVRWGYRYPYFMSKFRWKLVTPIELVV